MTKLTITLNVKDGVDLDTLKTDISKALIVIDGVEGITVAEGSVGKIIPVFTGESLARAVRHSETGADNA